MCQFDTFKILSSHVVTTSITALCVVKLFVPKVGTSSIDWTQVSRFHLKTETKRCLRIIVVLLVVFFRLQCNNINMDLGDTNPHLIN
jgi:hypothetical protein